MALVMKSGMTFSGILERAVVVRGARHNHGHAVGRPVAVRQPIRARLARRVGIARPELVGLAARSLRHAAVHLVGRDLHEPPERGGSPRRFEQHEGAEDVGRDELAGAHERPVDVGLGGEMHDDFGRAHERPGHVRIRHVPLDERVARMVDDVLQILHPARVRQLVERRDVPVRMDAERIAHEVRADEPGAAGDEDVNHLCASSRHGQEP